MCHSQRRRDKTRPAVHFAEYMTQWFAGKKATWKASTTRAMESILRVHLIPHFADQDLSTITSVNIHGLMSKMLAAGLSKKTVNNVLGVLKTALGDAVEFQYLTQNNADHVRALKVVPSPLKFWTEEQSEVFFAAAENHELEWSTFFRVALTTGLRFGELTALTWDQVDLVRNVILVDRSVYRGQADRPKYAQRREVPLHAKTCAALVRHREQRDLQTDLIFSGSNGSFLSESSVRSRFQRISRDAGLPAIRFNDLRHSFAAQLVIRGGAPI